MRQRVASVEAVVETAVQTSAAEKVPNHVFRPCGCEDPAYPEKWLSRRENTKENHTDDKQAHVFHIFLSGSLRSGPSLTATLFLRARQHGVHQALAARWEWE